MRSRGFTLVEMLVVIVIIGVLASLAVLSLATTGRDAQLERERDRLSALLDYVRERAALQTVEYGLRCYEDGYQFVQYDDRKGVWAGDALDDTLRERPLPPGLTLALRVEDRPVVLRTRAQQRAKQREEHSLAPQVMLFSGGDLTRFSLTLARSAAGRSVTLSAGADGKLQIGEISEAPP